MKFTAPCTPRVHLSIQKKIDVLKFYKYKNCSSAEAIKWFAHYRLKYGAAKNLFKKCSTYVTINMYISNKYIHFLGFDIDLRVLKENMDRAKKCRR